MILTYKYRLKDKSAKKTLQKHAIAVNQVWNYCNETQIKSESNYRSGEKKRYWLSHFDMVKLIKGSSKELGIHAQTSQCTSNHYCKSRDKKRKHLKFRKSYGPEKSLGWIPFQKQSRQISGNSVKYMGTTYRWFGNKRRPLPDNVKGGCFVEDASGKWWVCFDVEVDSKETGSGEVGIDLGLKSLATLSNGDSIEAMQFYRKSEEKLKSAQRSRNKKRVRAIHKKIANQRRDQLHKVSTKIAKENKLIVVGDASSSKLAKTKMSKSIYDAGWYSFKEMIRYKASRHGSTFLEVNEAFTTQVCSCCGVISDNSPKGMAGLGIRVWECSACGEIHDRDVNSAKNILRIGLSTQPPAEGSLLSNPG